MSPIDYVFQSITTLTGGLITDMTTAIVGVLAVMFVCLGVDLLKDVLLGPTLSRNEEERQYKHYKERRERTERFRERYASEHEK